MNACSMGLFLSCIVGEVRVTHEFDHVTCTGPMMESMMSFIRAKSSFG